MALHRAARSTRRRRIPLPRVREFQRCPVHLALPLEQALVWYRIEEKVVEERQCFVVAVRVADNGDAYDNAMAESVIGLFKTEVIRHAGPWRGLDDVEYATLEWVSWFNTSRLLEPLGYLPPAEYEAQFQEQFQELQTETISAGALK